MRVVFLGNDVWSVRALEALVDAPGLDVVLVVTNPPQPAGRGSVPTMTPVADRARGRLALAEVAGVRQGEGLDALVTARPEVLAVVAYGQLLTPEVLDVPTRGAINLHFSLLPRWRGAAPVQHALLAGDAATGVTTMRMDEGLDTGPILEQREEPIRPEDDAGTLGARLAGIGAELLVHTLGSLDLIEPRQQPTAGVTWAPKLTSTDRIVDWSQDAEGIVRRVRAFAPDPGARTTFRSRSINILLAESFEGSGTPGSILGVDDRGVRVAAGRDGVRLRTVAPAGRRHMSAAEWANGARLAPLERLG
jgi:methionyl-tRNA formyltransferase